jgi:hypothetical protein
MEEENIQTLIVDADRVIWKEEGREVTIDGEYFDLVSWTLKDGKYTFTGVFDREETAVVNMLEKQTGTGFFISRLLVFLQCFAAIVICIIGIFSLPVFQKHFTYLTSRYKSLFEKNIGYPPKFVLRII